MTDERRTREEAERLTEAVAWRARFPEEKAEESAGFAAWLAEPGNAEAWNEIDRAWRFFEEQGGEPQMIQARRAALGDAQRAFAERHRPRHWRAAALGAAAVFVGGFIVWSMAVWAARPVDYATALGERRVVTLEDGSRISLDSNSEVTVHYGKEARTLRLLRGQARFDVAHDVERPFTVEAGTQKVIATGTAFNVDLAGSSVLVTLIEGRVVVVNEAPKPIAKAVRASTRPESVELKAGQQLAALPEKPPSVAPANIRDVVAWTGGQLMFDETPLAEVVARVNRYTDTPVRVADPKIARMKISGDFNTGDVQGFVVIVTSYLPLKAVPQDDGSIVLAARR